MQISGHENIHLLTITATSMKHYHECEILFVTLPTEPVVLNYKNSSRLCLTFL